MKNTNIGILLNSNQSWGGSFQYDLSVLKALHFLKQQLPNTSVDCHFNDIFWSNYIPKSFNQIFYKRNIFLRILFFIAKKFLIKTKLIFFFGKLSPNTSHIDFNNYDFFVFPSQNIEAVFINNIKTKIVAPIHDLMHIYEKSFAEYSFSQITYRNFLYKNYLSKASIILVDSQIGKLHCENNFSDIKAKLSIHPFAYPAYLIEKKEIDIKKKYNLIDEYFLYPAQYWEHKNHKNLIIAFKKFVKFHKNTMLILIGKKKYQYKKILKLIKDLDIFNSVIIIDYVADDEMYSFYNKSLGLIYPSFCGPTNIPPLEAVYCNCPVAVSDVYGMKNQLKTYSYYFNPNSTKEILNSMLYLKRNYKEIKKRNVKKFINKYSQESFNKYFYENLKVIL